MPYATKQDLIDRFGATEIIQRTDRVNRPPTTIDDAVVDRAIGDADARIDGYLQGVYALPLASTPPALTKIAADIARYHLYGTAADKDNPVTRAYGDALAWLRDVSKGVVKLDVGGVAPEPAPGGAGRVTGSESVFTRDSLRGF